VISLSPGLVIGKNFQLDRLIARGGMGSVWSAFNTQLETPVAVKFMSPSAMSSPEMVGRFLREAKAAAQLRSPHVVQIFEHGVHEGLPYIAMELLEGEDLGKRISGRGRLSLAETADVVAQVCKALRRAHEAGIVHRDLKPANVFLARHDDDEIVKVLDFGIAKSLVPSGDGEEATQTGTLVGTPHYMSPEQARRSKDIDSRSDLWSLGVIAFRALTGKLPFIGDDMINVLVKVCTDPIPLPSSFVPELGPDVDAFFERALSRDLAGRFQTARELSDAFADLVGRQMAYSEISLEAYVPAPPSSRSAARTSQPFARPITIPTPPSRSAARASQPFARPITAPAPPSRSAARASQPTAQPITAPAPPSRPGAPLEREEAATVPLGGPFQAGAPPLPFPVPARAAQPPPPPIFGAPMASPSFPPAFASGGTITHANTETPLPVAFAPPSRSRIGLVLGGAGALLLLILVAGLWGTSEGEHASAPPSASPAAPATGSEPAAAATPAATGPSPEIPASASPSPSVSAKPAPSLPHTGDVLAAEPRATSLVKSPIPTARPTGAAPKATGAIGGAPKF
jgi:serine/threonine protein kinase